MTRSITEKPLVFKYTNYKGETATRTVRPANLWYGVTQYHKEEQWFLSAFDIEKQAYRDFAVVDIKEFSKEEK